MPTTTYTPLANITLSSAAASVTFSSISQAYRDLILVANVRSTRGSGGDYPEFEINADTGANYNFVQMWGDGSNPYSASGTNRSSTGTEFMTIPTAASAANTYATIVMNIMDYSATDKHKTILIAGDTPVFDTLRASWRWASTSAITQFKLHMNFASYEVGSTFSLFGVAA